MSFKDLPNVMSIIKKLPESLQVKFDNPILLDKEWSDLWDDYAKSLIVELAELRDSEIITKDEFSILHKKVFHSFGIIGNPEDSDFFKFFIGMN